MSLTNNGIPMQIARTCPTNLFGYIKTSVYLCNSELNLCKPLVNIICRLHDTHICDSQLINGICYRYNCCHIHIYFPCIKRLCLHLWARCHLSRATNVISKICVIQVLQCIRHVLCRKVRQSHFPTCTTYYFNLLCVDRTQ
jgi:hypothetical protein